MHAEKNKKRVLILCAHDGVTTFYCGVGKVVINALKALQRNSEFKKNFELHIFTPEIDRDSPFFKIERYAFSKKIVGLMGGKLHEIRVLPTKESADINSNWGESQWEYGSNEVAKFINSIKNREIIFIAHDIYFGLVCKYVNQRKGLVGCYIPHSTGKLFNEKYRLNHEKEIHENIVSKNFKIGYISDFMRMHLINDYGLNESLFISIKNELLGWDREDGDEKTQIVKSKKILEKINRNIIFSYGRCSEQKGFHTLIDAFLESNAPQKNYLLVMLAPTDITPKEYLKLIRDKVKKNNSILFIEKFLSPLPFLRSSKTKVIVLASEFECAPITALEVEKYSKHSHILYLDIPPFVEVFKHYSSADGIRVVKKNNKTEWVRLINTSLKKEDVVRKVKVRPYEVMFKKFIDDLEGGLKN